MAVKYDQIPVHMMVGIRRYIDHGAHPGDFLRAVICNDLKEAVNCADDSNLLIIHEYVRYFYNEAPMVCWGSKEKMDAWCAAKRAEHDQPAVP